MFASRAAQPLPTRLLALLSAAILLATSLTVATPALAARPGDQVHFWLTVLHNNDGESRLVNAGSGPLEDFGGVARFKTVVDRLRAEATTGRPPSPGAKRGVVMLSSGDNFLAGTAWNASLVKGPPYYDAIALDAIGYDAIAIGNHEFDFGPDVLAGFIESFSSPVPFVSANLDFSGEPRLAALEAQGRIAASVVVQERGERIGIVGATTPLLPAVSSPRNVVVDPAVAAAVQREVDMLTVSGVNKIILISHLQSVQEDRTLAAQLSNVDIIIAGGGDEVLANEGPLVPGDSIDGPYPIWETDADGRAVPIVTTAGNYKYVGRLVVGFNKQGEILTSTTSATAVNWFAATVSAQTETVSGGPVRVAGGDQPDAVTPDPVLQATVVEPVVEYEAELANNVLATSQVALEGSRPTIRVAETNLGNLVADSLLWQAQQLAPSFGVPSPQIALQNGGGIRNDSLLPAGNLTEKDTFDVLPFGNFVSVVPDVPRAQLKELLENAYSRVAFVDGRFAHVAGMSVVYDMAGTAQVVDNDGNVLTPGTRIRSVTLDDGTPIVVNGVVQAGAGVSIATIDFLARGGDQYPYRGAAFTTLGVTYQAALASYLTDGLSGLVSAADYPEGGEGRITRLN